MNPSTQLLLRARNLLSTQSFEECSKARWKLIGQIDQYIQTSKNTVDAVWIPCFTWLPTKTVDGNWIWFVIAERCWDWELNPWGYCSYSGSDGGYKYRKLLSNPTGIKR